MSDAVTAILSVVSSLLVAWAMYTDVEFQQAAERGELKHYGQRRLRRP